MSFCARNSYEASESHSLGVRLLVSFVPVRCDKPINETDIADHIVCLPDVYLVLCFGVSANTSEAHNYFLLMKEDTAVTETDEKMLEESKQLVIPNFEFLSTSYLPSTDTHPQRLSN